MPLKGLRSPHCGFSCGVTLTRLESTSPGSHVDKGARSRHKVSGSESDRSDDGSLELLRQGTPNVFQSRKASLAPKAHSVQSRFSVLPSGPGGPSPMSFAESVPQTFQIH